MLTKIEIMNFQSHKNTIIEFIPGTNVIIGPSDTGKSVILRAINWVCSNRPLGDAFCSEWGGETKVILHTSEGNIIEKIRTTTKNEYVINGKVLAAFGHNVPQEVTDILQMDASSIQAQMSPPFLLANTPGEAAQMLNKAAAIDDIDHTLAGLKKRYSQLDNDIIHDKKQLAEYVEGMEQYTNIPIIEKRLKRVERLETGRMKQAQVLESLQQMVEKAENIEEKLKNTEHIPVLFQECIRMEKLHNRYQNKCLKHAGCTTVVKKIKKIQDTLNSTEYVGEGLSTLKQAKITFENWKKKTEQIAILQLASSRIKEVRILLKSMGYIKKTTSLLEETRNLFSNCQDMKYVLEKLKQIVICGQRTVTTIDLLQKKIDQIEEEFHELAPEYCPLCDNKIEV